jgi:hypothetical protein
MGKPALAEDRQQIRPGLSLAFKKMEKKPKDEPVLGATVPLSKRRGILRGFADIARSPNKSNRPEA